MRICSEFDRHELERNEEARILPHSFFLISERSFFFVLILKDLDFQFSKPCVCMQMCMCVCVYFGNSLVPSPPTQVLRNAFNILENTPVRSPLLYLDHEKKKVT